jgi:serine/threonine protein phosphatase PrpC
MKFNISGFTHLGTVRNINQDRILIQDQILLDGIYDFEQIEQCFCFVADGIGGNRSGEIAAQFVLEKLLNWREQQTEFSEEGLRSGLEQINNDLILFGKQQQEHYGLATTLVGLIIRDNQFFILHAGDSPMWLLRNNLFYQLTENQVINPYEKDSPLTSYFGGTETSLALEFGSDLREIQPQDLFVLCSDGLLKALNPKQVKAILANNQQLKEKVQFLRKKVLDNQAEDNVSCIVVEII